MDLIRDIKIISVEIEGVRGIKDLIKVELEEGRNVFQGGNDAGKSSFIDGILWAFSGLSREGKNKNLRILNNDSKKARCKVIFNGDGKVHSLERIEKQTDSSDRKKEVKIKFDGKEITQTKLNQMIPQHIICMANIDFFLTLDSKKQREFTSKLIPVVSTESILEQMYINLQEYPLELFENPQKTIRELNSGRLRLEREIESANAQIEQLQSLKPCSSGQVLDTSELIETLEKQEKRLKKVLSAVPKDLLSLEEVLSKKASYEKEIEALQNPETAREIEALEKQLISEKQILQLEQSKCYQEKGNIELVSQKVESKRETLKRELAVSKEIKLKFKELQQKKEQFHEGESCPCCKGKLSKDGAAAANLLQASKLKKKEEAILEEFEDRQKTIEVIKTEGLKLVKEIEQLEELNKQSRLEFENHKNEIVQKLQASIQDKETQLSKLKKLLKASKASISKKVKEIESNIQDLKIADIQKTNSERQCEFDKKKAAEVTRVEENIKILREQLKEIEMKNAVVLNQTKQNENIEGQLKYSKNVVKENKASLKRLNLTLNTVKGFVSKRQELVNRQLQQYLKDVSIELEQLNLTTGEVEECFIINYKGKDLRDTSRSGNMRTGIEIATMIFELTGVNYFVCIDDAESLEYYTIPDSIQAIEVKMVPAENFSKVCSPTKQLALDL